MKTAKNVLVLIVFLIFSVLSSSAQKKSKAPSEPVKITTVEGITEYQLGNGLRVLLFPDQSKSTITVNMTYLVGSRMEGYGESGMAHLLEHMVFKGTPKHKNIPQELTSHGARPNGSTWYDRTNYFESFSASDENLNWALDLESDRMINSFIAKKDLESEFSVVRNEFESGENNPDGVLNERVMSTAYLWHNYGKSTIGSKEDIEFVPIENLQAFYKKYYQPDNAVLTIAGKIDNDKIMKLVNKYFGVIPKPTRKLQETFTVEPVQDGERLVTLKRTGDIQIAAAGYHIPSGSHPDYTAVEILVDILTNEPSGRLYKALVESKKASVQYGSAYPPTKDPAYAYFAAQVLKDKSLDSALWIMKDLFDNLTKNPVTQAEVDRAKNKILKDFDQTYNNSDRVGLNLSEYIAQGDWRLWFIYRDNVEKTTVDDVNRVAKEYFKPSNRTVGLFIPDAAPDRAKIPPSPNTESLVKDYKGKKSLADAEAFDPSPMNIENRTKKGSIAENTISGGSKWSFLKKTTRGNSVTVNITLRLGNETALKNKGTISNYTASMLRRGTVTKTYQQINDEFDKLKANVSIFGGGQNVGISITTVKDNLVEVLKSVTEILRHPSFPADEFEKMKAEELASIDQQKSEPQSIAFNILDKINNPFPESDFRYPMNFDEQTNAVKNLKLEELKQFYSDFYNGVNGTVAVVGDFDENAVLAELKSMLQNWNSTVKYEYVADPYFDIQTKFEKINTPDKANAMMAAGLNIPLRDDDADFAALQIGNYMLGGGFLNSRLATRIRQKEGLSYGVGSFLQAGQLDKSGNFGSYAIYNPDNSEKLIIAYKDELKKMITEGFTDAELKDAVKGFLQSRNVSRSQDRELVGRLSNYLFLNRTMNWDIDFEKKIASLTVDQVNAAMKKWINPDKITIVQAGDFERKK